MTKIARLLTPHPALLRLHIESTPDTESSSSASADRWRVNVLSEQPAPMLPPFIIEQIRKREIEERVQQEQPRLELPLDPRPMPSKPLPGIEEEKRGVIIVEL